MYNPLEKINLARSIEAELLGRQAVPLSSLPEISGAGIYIIYYTGKFKKYEYLSKRNNKEGLILPIYIGKAIPKGGRKGAGIKAPAAAKNALSDRLKQHAISIKQSRNLKTSDFYVRFLVVDDVWIPLGENILIESFRPVWNIALDGFGNKDPGKRRSKQFRSPWDVMHPGREFAKKLGKSPATPELLSARIADHFAGRPLTKLPKVVEEELAGDLDAAKDAAEEL